jgi:nitrate reductase delta subunit
MHTFKALGWLLTYPQSELVSAMPEALEAIASERLLAPSRVGLIARFVERMTGSDLIDLQEEYTATFDRGRATSLHLFEHVHGESRDRGQAMVDLIGLYQAQGLEMPGDELPDYLPLFLEYLSVLPLEQAKTCLLDAGAILANLHASLARRECGHAAIVSALLDIGGVKPLALSDEAQTPEEDIDAEWAEEPVTFGPQATSPCAKADQIVQRMQRNPGHDGAAR